VNYITNVGTYIQQSLLSVYTGDGVIILVVGASLLFILIVCLIGLMCTYCKSTKR